MVYFGGVEYLLAAVHEQSAALAQIAHGRRYLLLCSLFAQNHRTGQRTGSGLLYISHLMSNAQARGSR